MFTVLLQRALCMYGKNHRPFIGMLITFLYMHIPINLSD